MQLPRFRFRYNGLMIVCVILTFMVCINHIKIVRLQNHLQKYATVEQSKQYAQYSNYNVGQLEMLARDAMSMALSAWDKADTTRCRHEWIEGLTTDQIDSVRRTSERFHK